MPSNAQRAGVPEAGEKSDEESAAAGASGAGQGKTQRSAKGTSEPFSLMVPGVYELCALYFLLLFLKHATGVANRRASVSLRPLTASRANLARLPEQVANFLGDIAHF